MVANYSGWGPGQLDGELLADSWLTLPATADHVFWTGHRDLWNVAVNQVQARLWPCWLACVRCLRTQL